MSNSFLALRRARSSTRTAISLSISVTDDSNPPRLRGTTTTETFVVAVIVAVVVDATMRVNDQEQRRGRKSDEELLLLLLDEGNARKELARECARSGHRCIRFASTGNPLSSRAPVCVAPKTHPPPAEPPRRHSSPPYRARHHALFRGFLIKATFAMKMPKVLDVPLPPLRSKYPRWSGVEAEAFPAYSQRAAIRLATTARLSILQRRVAKGSLHQQQPPPRQQQRRKSGGRGAAARTRVLL